jgi:hypothetical protein
MRLVRSERINQNDAPLWRFRKLAFAFTLDDEGLSVTGRCDEGDSGAIVLDAKGTLLSDPPERVIPTLALVRALAPRSELQVPAAKETDLLLRLLPLPAIVPPHSANSQMPYSPLRLE